MYDTIIIGAGLMGSAAGRYLSEMGQRVAVIGPAEPADTTTHPGVLASHYDEGRLTRQIGRDAVWAAIARRAVAQYPLIEAQSGIRFHHPVGMLVVDTPDGFNSYIQRPLETAAALGIPHTVYPPGDSSWQAQFPEFAYPDRFQIIYEPGPAGYINPRRLVEAQLACAAQNGAQIVRQTVTAVRETADHVTIATDTGERFTAGQAIIAAGAFSNFNNLLPQPIPLTLKTETIILGEVSPADGQRLAHLPVIIYQIEDPDIDDIYMTPPICYPDGRWYIKMGCNTAADTRPETLRQVQEWFWHGDSDACQPAMIRALQAQLPGVGFLSFTSKRCIVCYTPSGYPTIGRVSDRLLVATGGNGSGAKGSDTLGWLAALTAAGQEWPEAFKVLNSLGK